MFCLFLPSWKSWLYCESLELILRITCLNPVKANGSYKEEVTIIPTNFFLPESLGDLAGSCQVLIWKYWDLAKKNYMHEIFGIGKPSCQEYLGAIFTISRKFSQDLSRYCKALRIRMHIPYPCASVIASNGRHMFYFIRMSRRAGRIGREIIHSRVQSEEEAALSLGCAREARLLLAVTQAASVW